MTAMITNIPALVHADNVCISSVIPPFVTIKAFCNVRTATKESITLIALSSATYIFALCLDLL